MATITFNSQFGVLNLNQIGTCHSFPVATLAGATVADESSIMDGMPVKAALACVEVMNSMFVTTRGALAVAGRNGETIIIADKESLPITIEREALLIKYFTSNKRSAPTPHTVEAERIVDERLVYSYKYTEDELIDSITRKTELMASVCTLKSIGSDGSVADESEIENISVGTMVAFDVENRITRIHNLMS